MFRFRRCRLNPILFAASSFLFGSSSTESQSTPKDKASELPRTSFKNINCTGFECIRESSMIALTTASSFLKHSLYYYSELTHRYCVHISSMINILEEYRKREGFENAQQEIWDLYVQQRVQLNEMKTELLRLRLLLSTIDRLVTESIDAGYQTQDETVTQLVSNELINAKRIIQEQEQLISNNEMTLTHEQVKLIGKAIDKNDINLSDK